MRTGGGEVHTTASGHNTEGGGKQTFQSRTGLQSGAATRKVSHKVFSGLLTGHLQVLVTGFKPLFNVCTVPCFL